MISYSKYKPSGVEWLGEVPEHWEVRRLGSIVQIINGATPESNTPTYWGGGIVWLTPEDLGRLTSRWIDNSARQITKDGYKTCGTTIAPTGSVAISTRAPIGYIGILNTPACVNQGCRLLVPTKAVHSSYLYYKLQVVRVDLASLGQGSTFTELSRSKLSGFSITLPPLPEQTAIVRYIDYFDRRIRRYIVAKQKLIKLLEEQRQVIIHRAVTRGLDPDVPLKHSGVEWLGEVPEHWETERLKAHVTNITEQIFAHESDTPCIALEHVESWTGIIRESSADTEFDSKVKIFQAGDVLFGKLRPYLAKVTRPKHGGVCVGEFLVLRMGKDSWSSAYLEKLLRSKSVIGIVNSSTFGAKMPRAEWQFIRSVILPLPPIPEQTAIVEYLDKATADIDSAITRARRGIDLLQEYRTRLIADVVTGKLDVREAAAALPDELTAGSTTALH